MAKYIIGFVHTSLSHFTVEAASDAEATEKALAAFGNGSEETILGNEYDQIERTFIDSKID